MRKVLWLGVLISTILFSQLFGFATLMAGNGDTILFTTSVPGVSVYKNGMRMMNISGTQQSFTFKRERGDVVLTFKKEGYHDQVITLQRSLAPVFFLNVLIGGVYGSTTDSIFTGNAMEFSPNQYYVELAKL